MYQRPSLWLPQAPAEEGKTMIASSSTELLTWHRAYRYMLSMVKKKACR